MASRGPLLLGTLWLTAAVTATSVGLLAVHLVGNEVGGQVAAPLSDQGVQQALGSVSPTPTHAQEPEAEHPEQGRARTVVIDGGVVSARCSGGAPRLLYATPADGFRTERGTRLVAFVGASQRVTLTMTCSGDELRTTTTTERIGTRSPSPAPVVQPAPSEAPKPTEQPDQPDRPDSHTELDSPSASDH